MAMTEKEVLHALNIPDFRHLSKDKVMSFVSMIPEMDPEVAKKAIEQFPEFSQTILDLAEEYKSIAEEALLNNKESLKACYDACDAIIESLKKQSKNKDLTFEERKYYVDKMIETAQIMQEKDTENKNFILKILGITGGAVVLLGGTLVMALGGKINIKFPSIK